MKYQKQLPNSYTSNGQGFWLALLKSLKHKLLVMLQKCLLLSQKVTCAKLYWKSSSPPPPLKKQKRSTRHNRDENLSSLALVSTRIFSSHSQHRIKPMSQRGSSGRNGVGGGDDGGTKTARRYDARTINLNVGWTHRCW